MSQNRANVPTGDIIWSISTVAGPVVTAAINIPTATLKSSALSEMDNVSGGDSGGEQLYEVTRTTKRRHYHHNEIEVEVEEEEEDEIEDEDTDTEKVEDRTTHTIDKSKFQLIINENENVNTEELFTIKSNQSTSPKSGNQLMVGGIGVGVVGSGWNYLHQSPSPPHSPHHHNHHHHHHHHHCHQYHQQQQQQQQQQQLTTSPTHHQPNSEQTKCQLSECDCKQCHNWCYCGSSNNCRIAVATTSPIGSSTCIPVTTTFNQQQQQQQLQRAQLKRKSYSSMMSSMMQRTISSSSSNSYFGTLDEEIGDTEIDSNIEHVDQCEVHKCDEEYQQSANNSSGPQLRRAYARSISFAGTRSSFYGPRYMNPYFYKRGVQFQRLDGRKLCPSISFE